MTNSNENENELKVGDVISERLRNGHEYWFAKTVIQINRYGDLRDDSFKVSGGNTIYFKNDDWQHGIHPSLLPEGFELVKKDDVFDLVEKTIIENLNEELEAARKEVKSLKLNNIRYQWIKNHARTIEWLERDEREGLFNGNKRPLLDQNIDAAIKRAEYKPEDKPNEL